MNRLLSSVSGFVFCGILLCGIGSGQQIDWMHDLESAQKVGADESKLILLHFSAEWCRPCKELETFVFKASAVVNAMSEKVVAVHVDTDKNPELVKQFSVDQIPMDVVLTPAGRVVAKRKSPSDTSNYLRMLKSLPLAKVANQLPGTEMAQKLDRVLDSNKNVLRNPTENDFAVTSPKHNQPKPSTESMKLAAKSRTRQVGHQENSFQPKQAVSRQQPKAVAAAPQRVINDKFFVQKSTASKTSNLEAVDRSHKEVRVDSALQATSPKIENDFAATVAVNKHEMVANAKIDSPFKAKTAKKGKLEPVAKILPPDLKKESDLLAQASSNDFQGAVVAKAPKAVAVKNVRTKTPMAKTTKLIAQPVTAMAKKQASGNRAKLQVAENIKARSTNKIQLQGQKRATLAVKQGTIQGQQTESKKSAVKDGQPEFALGGQCPVALLRDGKWSQGNRKFGCIHRGRIYIFTSQESLDLFQSAPDKYSPILAGYDPVEFHDSGRLVDGKEQHGVFMGKAPEQKIVLFSSPETRKKFQESPQKYMTTIRTAVQQNSRKTR